MSRSGGTKAPTGWSVMTKRIPDRRITAAWETAQSEPPVPEPQEPFNFVPIGDDVARMATRSEIFHALLWAVPASVRSGVLPLLVGGTALWTAGVLWLLNLGPFWLLLIYTFAATITVTLGWAVLTARHLSDPRQQVLISSRGDALLGLMLVRDPAKPYVKVHAHYATPVGAGSGRRFRAALTPYVKEFVTNLEPGMPIQFTCPRQLWQKLEQEIGQSFPAAEGWRVTRTKAVTSIQPPSVLDGPA